MSALAKRKRLIHKGYGVYRLATHYQPTEFDGYAEACMSDVKLPLSRRHLDIAIERLVSRFGEAQRIRRAVANTILAQLMPDCVIKGGSSLKFRMVMEKEEGLDYMPGVIVMDVLQWKKTRMVGIH